jgi:hypothetical protein
VLQAGKHQRPALNAEPHANADPEAQNLDDLAATGRFHTGQKFGNPAVRERKGTVPVKNIRRVRIGRIPNPNRDILAGIRH